MGRASTKSNEVKDETPFTYAQAEIRTQVVVIYGPTSIFVLINEAYFLGIWK